MLEIVEWLESPEGEAWSRDRHAPDKSHSSGVFGQAKACTPEAARKAEYACNWSWTLPKDLEDVRHLSTPG